MRPSLIPSLASSQPSLVRRAVRSAAVLGSLTGVFFCLTGCGLGTASISTPVASARVAGSFSGRLLGGSNPIIGATVKAYTTGTAYGAGVFAQEATAAAVSPGYPAGDTDMQGSFSFAGGYSCPTGQFLYLVSSGGNTGAASGSGATATAAESGGNVTGITVTAPGSGYVSAASVAITSSDSFGSGATATAQVAGGQVTGITVTAAGSGYDAAPNVTITPINGSAVLVAALGRCEDLFTAGAYTGGPVVMNELTTIAAAYALGHFSSESGSGASTIVGIGAPASNNAAEVSGVSTGCVAGDPVEGTGTTCKATATAGLAHAFENAANLVNYSPTGSSTSGANLAPPSDAAAVAPQALVNTLGNILVSCVNSPGGVSGDGSACGSIFQATTIGASVPVDTFGAMVNLAANPTLGGSVTAVDNFFALANSHNVVYSPSLSSAPLNDYSLAINYPATTGEVSGAQGITFPNSGALDINDVYFIGNQISSSGGAGENVIALGSNGAVLGASPNGATLAVAYGLSVDALGNGYFTNGSKSGTNALGHFTAVNGVPAQYTSLSAGGIKAYSSAVDQHNNVWVVGAGTTGNTVFESAAGGASFAAKAASSISPPGQNVIDIAIDPDQNVWTVAGSVYSILPNSGSVSAPAYAATLLTGSTGGSAAVGVAFGGTAPFTTANPYTAYVSSYNTTPGIQPFVPTLSANGEITAAGAGTLQTNASLSGSYFDEVDGDGNIWTADTNSHSIVLFVPGTTTAAYRYIPCLGTSGTCVSIFGTSGKPYDISIDSTGSIWTPAPGNGNVVQIIGAAAPTVPLLSLGATGRP